jgi:hypothetical protein
MDIPNTPDVGHKLDYDPYYAQYYYSKYMPREGEDEEGNAVDDGQISLSRKIRDIRDNNSIFRQDEKGAGRFVETAMFVASVVMNLLNGGHNEEGDILSIIDTLPGGTNGSSGAASQPLKPEDMVRSDDLGDEIGALMTYSGQFLRQIGLWAFDKTTQSSSDTGLQAGIKEKVTGGNPASTASETGGILQKLLSLWYGGATSDRIGTSEPSSGNMVTRLVSSLGLQHEALALQSTLCLIFHYQNFQVLQNNYCFHYLNDQFH